MDAQNTEQIGVSHMDGRILAWRNATKESVSQEI